jgi:hypothetical protein
MARDVRARRGDDEDVVGTGNGSKMTLIGMMFLMIGLDSFKQN